MVLLSCISYARAARDPAVVVVVGVVVVGVTATARGLYSVQPHLYRPSAGSGEDES